jgi:hypothetical protein
MGFLVNKMAPGQVFSEHLDFPLPTAISPAATSSFIILPLMLCSLNTVSFVK